MKKAQIRKDSSGRPFAIVGPMADGAYLIFASELSRLELCNVPEMFGHTKEMPFDREQFVTIVKKAISQ